MMARYGVTVSVAFAVKVDVLTYVAVTVTLFPTAAFAPEVIVTGSPWVTVKLVVSLTVQVAVDETSTGALTPVTVASAVKVAVPPFVLMVPVVGEIFSAVTFPRLTVMLEVPLVA
jgi:hypothetical protein